MTSSPEALEALARAYDREDASQRGEPDPWDYDDGNEAEREWRAERIACAQVGLAAYLASSPEGRQEAAVLDEKALEIAAIALAGSEWNTNDAPRFRRDAKDAISAYLAALQAPATPDAQMEVEK